MTGYSVHAKYGYPSKPWDRHEVSQHAKFEPSPRFAGSSDSRRQDRIFCPRGKKRLGTEYPATGFRRPVGGGKPVTGDSVHAEVRLSKGKPLGGHEVSQQRRNSASPRLQAFRYATTGQDILSTRQKTPWDRVSSHRFSGKGREDMIPNVRGLRIVVVDLGAEPRLHGDRGFGEGGNEGGMGPGGVRLEEADQNAGAVSGAGRRWGRRTRRW